MRSMRTRLSDCARGVALARRHITAADAVLLLLLASVNGALYALPAKQAGHAGSMVELSNATTAEKVSYPLSVDQTLQAQGRSGPITVEIRDQQVRFAEAPCSKKICIHAGWLRHAGQWAACLEGGVSLQVLGIGKRHDSISY